MSDEGHLTNLLEEVHQLLDVPQQIWLFGAGISFNAGIPLMYPLTKRVENMLAETHQCLGNDSDAICKSASIFAQVYSALREDAHVEHILNYLCDLISIVSQQSTSSTKVGQNEFTKAELETAHRHILLAIRHTVEFGYRPSGDSDTEMIGEPGNTIVSQSWHDRFVHALFSKRRAGLERRPAINFVTTNYDTLLEDALANARVACIDGFAGGATGFWDPRHANERLKQASRVANHTATLCKLHGSVDWTSDDRGTAMRVRSSMIDPSDPDQSLLIYPQATKYQVTQRDPFASLFLDFRKTLVQQRTAVLVICGYSFGDEHINEEIELALRNQSSDFALLALCQQASDAELSTESGLPPCLHYWLQNPEFGKRIRVLGSRGFFRGASTPMLEMNRELKWWTFQGVTELLEKGVEADV